MSQIRVVCNSVDIVQVETSMHVVVSIWSDIEIINSFVNIFFGECCKRNISEQTIFFSLIEPSFSCLLSHVIREGTHAQICKVSPGKAVIAYLSENLVVIILPSVSEPFFIYGIRQFKPFLSLVLTVT